MTVRTAYSATSDRALTVNATENYGVHVIKVSRDKLHICLMEAESRKSSNKDWIAPAGLIATILLTFLTASFKDAIGLDHEVWQAFFIILLVLCVIWFFVSLFQIERRWTIEEQIERIKTAYAEVPANEPSLRRRS